MELLEKLGIDGRLLLWQAINFAILLIILRKFAYRPILSVLENRRLKIEKGLDDARRSGEALQAAEEERDKIAAEARRQASLAIAGAEEASRKIRELAVQKAKDEAQAVLEAGQAEVERERRLMLREAKSEIAALITLGVDKVIGKASPKIDFEPLVAETVREMKK